MLKICLFGPPLLYLNGVSLANQVTGRELALLAYCAVARNLQQRSTLSDLLWQEIGEQQARKNLRNLLYSLRQSIGDYLDSSRQTIGLAPSRFYWLDVEIFSNYWATPQNDTGNEMLSAILSLYQGDFLQGFAIQEAPVFEAWLLMQRRILQEQAIHGFHRLAQHCLVTSNYDAGLVATRRLLTMAPWHESAHRQQMLLLALSGQRSVALAQYELCQQALAEEYGVAPMPETTALYMQIKAGGLVQTVQGQVTAYPSKAASVCPAPSMQTLLATNCNDYRSPNLPQVNWDAIPTVPRLYGREIELGQLEQWVLSSHCRVGAVVGLGGQGKTVLLAEFVHRLVEKAEMAAQSRASAGRQASVFTHILWASVMNSSSLAQILHTWLLQLAPESELSIPIHSQSAPSLEPLLARFIHHLRTARCLLILDQVEMLWGNGAEEDAEQQALTQLLRWVAESEHQSCLLLSSRKQLPSLTRLARHTSAVRTLRLTGLSTEASSALLRQRGLDQPSLELALLATHYGGHPLALTLLTEIVQDFPAHTLDLILQQDPLLFDELQTMLGGQLQQLPALAREMVIWLALEQMPVAFEVLWEYFLATHSASAVMAAYRILQQALLIEQSPDGQAICLPALFQIYGVQHLIDQIVAELNHWTLAKSAFLANGTGWTGERLWGIGSTANDHGRRHTLNHAERFLAPTYLNTYRLLNPHRPDSVQRAQKQCILYPILKQLVPAWSAADLTSHIYDLLVTVNAYSVPVGRYAKTNLHTLLALLEMEFHTTNKQNTVCVPG